MLQKSHKDYGTHCNKEASTMLAQTGSGSGSQTLTQVGAEAEMLSFEHALQSVQQWA